MGLPTLTRALDEIAGQVHRTIEIVIVDAAGSGWRCPSTPGLWYGSWAPASALARESPTLPVEGSTPISVNRSEFQIDGYCDP